MSEIHQAIQAAGRTGGYGGTAPAGPDSRYILPSFEERTAYGFKRQDPYAKLFEDRIIFLGVQIDDASADDVMAQLLVLESQDPDRDITLYINSPGGSQTALTAIYDTMQYIKPQVQTVCLGQAASAAAVLLAAGSPGKRLALPNARVMIHQPRIEGGARAQASDIEIYAEEMVRMREWLEYTLAKHTGQTEEKVRDDIERDRFLSAQDAKDYGLVDQVLDSRKGVDTAAPSDRASGPVIGSSSNPGGPPVADPDGPETNPDGPA
ncbi:ATP-dependent Clp protease proteolytic subunit [Demequina sp. SO4-18]|uniref:ATP-dependent Clp protease proteolytic subunit n=1 Tax=Demequina sp. SO4-18 TaxID=3401026 RepID=UPI003B5A7483